jgi:hypothetical protein
MYTAFTPPGGIVLVCAALGALLAAILPTCIYLYVEPKGRRQWAAAGEGASAGRKAPMLVRATAWLSLAVGQLALPWLLVPVACAALLYLQAKLGVARPVGMAVTATLGAAAIVQSLLAFRLLPLGVRLLARDAKLAATLGARARWNGLASAAVLGGSLLIGWAMTAVPSFVHPWLRAALAWTALRPVMAYASVCLLHAMLLGRCAQACRPDEKEKP